MDDDEWDELWELLSAYFSDDNLEEIDEMDWDEFIEFLTYFVNEL